MIGVFTRFAVERSPSKPFFSNEKGRAWIDSSLKIATETSIPSVGQLNPKPEYWFILIDSSLSAPIKHKIGATFLKYSSVRVHIIEVDGWQNCSKAIRESTEAQKVSLQIRLDYDDMLSRDYIAIALSTLESKKTQLFCPIKGILLQKHPSLIARIVKDKPPFSALFRHEPILEHLNIFSFDHDQWPENTIVRYSSRPLWVQSITGQNISNRFNKGWLVSDFVLLPRISLNEWSGTEVMYQSSKPYFTRMAYNLIYSSDVLMRLALHLKRCFPNTPD